MISRRDLSLAAIAAASAPAWAQRDPILRVGDAAPALSSRTTDSRPYKLDSGKGQVQLVAFWATWCPTCRVEMPEFRKAHEKWSKQGFELVTVSIDKRLEDVIAYDRMVEASVPVTQRFAQLWRGATDHVDGFGRIPSTPTSYIIDRKGTLTGIYKGRVTDAQWAEVEKLVTAKKA